MSRCLPQCVGMRGKTQRLLRPIRFALNKDFPYFFICFYEIRWLNVGSPSWHSDFTVLEVTG